MTASALCAFGRAAIVLAAATLVAGCATRFDAHGNQIYVWQYGQGSSREIDYSDPRLPILPPSRPSTDLWPVPSPFDFNDLSQWSLLDEAIVAPAAPRRVATRGESIALGDNRACVACDETTVHLALAAPRAVDRRHGDSRIAR
ncbi:MAG: hypothetical protein IT516_10605 [Burkholderiales bacterium]|nr:hypothetical protein [Burkholderiales bacterium]